MFYLLTVITHDAGLSKFLLNIRSPPVVYNAYKEDYFTGLVMGVTNVFQNKMEISNSKTTSKPSDNKVRIVRIE